MGAVNSRSFLLTLSLFRRRKGHGQTNTRRRLMGTHRNVAAAAQASALTQSGAQATRKSRGTERYSVHPPDRSALGPATTRDGLWKRYELLAPSSRLAGGRRPAFGMSYTKCCLRVCVRPTRSIGPGSSSTPLQFVPSVLVKNGTQSHRPRATRFKAPPHYRSAGHPARGHLDGRQPPRCHPAPCSG